MHNPKAIQEAVQAVLSAVQDADAREMVGKRPPKKVEVEVESAGDGAGDPDCPMCQKMGHACPEHSQHESEEMGLIQALEDMHGGEAAEEQRGTGGRY